MPGKIPTMKTGAKLVPIKPKPSEAKAFYANRPERREDNAFYCSAEWRKLRSAYLAEHPLCEECQRRQRVEAATDVHHKAPRKANPDLALAWDNLEALCRRCHNAKEVR